jgi:polar amino acid transport system permease protein
VVDFSFWDIFRNLLLAARWTVGLSLIAFMGGGVVGMALLVARTARLPGAQVLVGRLCAAVSGHTAADAAVPGLLRHGAARRGNLGLGGRRGADAVHQRLPHRDLAGCVRAIPKGQWEAGQSLALSFGEKLRYVVLPQAGRMAMPPTVGFLVQVIKGTALASVIGFIELTKAGTMITNATFKPFLVYSCVALMYFALCFPISLYARSLEKELNGIR